MCTSHPKCINYLLYLDHLTQSKYVISMKTLSLIDFLTSDMYCNSAVAFLPLTVEIKAIFSV